MSSRAARAIEQHDACHSVAFREQAIERRPQRREAEPAGDDDDIASLAPRAIGQPTPNGPRTPIGSPGMQLGERARDGADGADRVDEPRGLGRIAADADRRLADAEGGEHVELPRRETPRSPSGFQLERDTTSGRLAAAAAARARCAAAIGSTIRAGASDMGAIDIEHLQPRGVQALDQRPA